MERIYYNIEFLISEDVSYFWKELIPDEIPDEYLIRDEKGNCTVPNRDKLNNEEVLPFFTSFHKAFFDLRYDRNFLMDDSFKEQQKRIFQSRKSFKNDFLQRHFPGILSAR